MASIFLTMLASQSADILQSTSDIYFEDDLEATEEADKYEEAVKRINYSAKKENLLQLIESHKKRWAEINGTPYPKTKAELLKRKTEMPPVTAYAEAIGIPVEVHLIFVALPSEIPKGIMDIP